MTSVVISRRRHGRSFRYYDHDQKPLNKTDSRRINALAIPPAWENVEIDPDPDAKVQAVGVDGAGRKQYMYHPEYRKQQEEAKFARIMQFATNLPRLRGRLEKDIARKRFDKKKVLACAVSLMDETYFRVGNDQYAKANHSYGLTTLRSKHVTVKGDTVTFDFVGKSGQAQHRSLTDRTIARLIRKLDDMPGYELFRYYDRDGTLTNLTSQDVNEYIKSIIGDEYSAKDFRTWGGTLAAALELARAERPETESARKKAITACVKRVARKLGNTPAIARSSYIDPRLFAMFNESNTISDVAHAIKRIKPKKYQSSDEQAVLKLLASH